MNDGTTWTFVNKDGSIVRQGYRKVEHSAALSLWAAKERSGKWVVFDEDNNNLPELSGYREFFFPLQDDAGDVFVVKNDTAYGAITKSGSVKVPLTYELARACSYGVVSVRKGGKWGLVDADGKTLVPCDYANIVLPEEKGAKDFWVKKADNLYYHYHADTKRLAPTGFLHVTAFRDGLAHVQPTGMKLDDTEVNRAQIFPPNTDHAKMDTVEVEKYRDAFGYLLRADDRYLIDLPISTLYIDAVMARMKAMGLRDLTESEKKDALLEATRENRTYKLKETLSEDEWNY